MDALRAFLEGLPTVFVTLSTNISTVFYLRPQLTLVIQPFSRPGCTFHVHCSMLDAVTLFGFLIAPTPCASSRIFTIVLHDPQNLRFQARRNPCWLLEFKSKSKKWGGSWEVFEALRQILSDAFHCCSLHGLVWFE